ncbi:MAG: hypothetical protein LQ349_005195, partial [Xanthoria aureola]
MAITKCGKLLRQPVVALPDFLIPSFQSHFPGTRRSFASSAPRPSRVGKAAIALPKDVHLRLLDPPRRKGAITRVEPPKTVEIEGPLGKASFQLPHFVNYNIDDAAKKATLSVLDKKSRDQREMW